MPTNSNVERMAVNADALTDYPIQDMPEIPMHIRAKNPLWQEYHEQQQLWWRSTKPLLENLSIAIKKLTQ